MVFQSKIIFNSSQEIEAKLLEYRLKDHDLFNVYEHEDTNKFNLKISYN